MNIPLMDLKAQYRSIREEVLKRGRGCWRAAGISSVRVKALEEEVAALAVGRRSSVANGTDALVTLDALESGPGTR